MTDTTPNQVTPEQAAPSDENAAFQEEPVRELFYMAAIKAVYTVGKEAHARDMNVLIQSADGRISSADLANVNQAVLHRLNTENQVSPTDVKDMIFLTATPLGWFTKEEFHNNPDPSTVPMEPSEAAA